MHPSSVLACAALLILIVEWLVYLTQRRRDAEAQSFLMPPSVLARAALLILVVEAR